MTAFTTALLQDIALFSILIGLGAFIAKKRGRNIIIWGIAGILIIPTIVLLFMPKKLEDNATQDS